MSDNWLKMGITLVCSLELETSEVFSGLCTSYQNLTQTNRLSDISPTKSGLFGISRICQSSHIQRLYDKEMRMSSWGQGKKLGGLQ